MKTTKTAKTTTDKTRVKPKSKPVKAVKQEKKEIKSEVKSEVKSPEISEITKALMIVPEVKAEIKDPEVSEIKVEVKSEVKSEIKVPKKKKDRGEVRHVIGNSKNGKKQQRYMGTAEGRNRYNHKLGSQAAKIDHLVEAGRFNLNEILAMSGARTKGRLYNHFRALKEKGYIVITDENKKLKFA